MFVNERTLYRSFMESAIAAFATMVLIGTGTRFWHRGQVGEVSAPGGVAQATRRPLRILVEGLTGQMDTVNQRLTQIARAYPNLGVNIHATNRKVNVHTDLKATTVFGEPGQENIRMDDFRECLADAREIVEAFNSAF
jgi:hypothetical protein